MMTKKNYIRIAEILNKHSKNLNMNLVNDLMDYFEEDNPLFDRSKFKEAVTK